MFYQIRLHLLYSTTGFKYCMKSRKLIAPLTIFFIFLSGCLLQTIDHLGIKIDAVSGATKSDYGNGDYDRFLQKFQLPPDARNYEVLSLHERSAVYTVLINTEKEGGASASLHMSDKVTGYPKMIIPYDKEDAAYTAHTEEISSLFTEKGYAVEARPYDTLMFRSLVHSGHFDLILLEKRASL